LESKGVTDLKDDAIVEWIDATVVKDGIGNQDFENDRSAKETLATLNLLYALFKDDPMAKDGGVVQELTPDYVVLSMFMLARYLKANYKIDSDIKQLLREFYISFHERCCQQIDLSASVTNEWSAFGFTRKHA